MGLLRNLFGADRPGQSEPLLRYAHSTDKEYDGPAPVVQDHQAFYLFTDGSWFNGTTGEYYNATGTGVLECTGYHWSYSP